MILTVCPTRERPKLAKQMLDSFVATSTENNIMLFLVDEEDEKVEEYKSLYTEECLMEIAPRQTVTELINKAYTNYPDAGCYHITNDDFIYQTKGWDSIFVKKLEEKGYGICYGNDLLQMERMPTAPFISGNIVSALGWLQMPTLTHLGGDCAWMEIGKAIESIHYFPNVIIEHKHYQARKAPIDNVYKKTNSGQMYQQDAQAFREWRSKEFNNDINRVRMALRNR
jgi:hypothetical protein